MTTIYNDKADDEKYVTYNRDQFMDWLADSKATTADIDGLDALELKDAVVIRRQDLYASPGLASYAASIAIAVKTTDDPKTKANLQAIADYFQRQSELAAEEGWKLPDL